MCGIAAFFAYHYAAPPPGGTAPAQEAMRARGPDGAGVWRSADGRAVLAHNRLAIIDLSERAAQPMRLEEAGLAVSFNGEIYNYRQIRARLEASGERFFSDSDTEVLLRLYARDGDAMVRDLRGMFAFALWDGPRRRLLLARDPYGIKPLYYADDGWTVRAASQVRALLCLPEVSKEEDPAGAAGFFLWGSVPEPYTPYRAIRQVPAGAVITVDALGPSGPARYFSVSGAWAEAERSPVTGSPRVADALKESVRHHFVSDVPVGLFLSSGIDSAALAGLAADCGFPGMRSVTLAFDEFAGRPEDEAPLAERVARHYGMAHRTHRVSRAQVRDLLPKFFAAMDQPSIDGLNVYLVSAAAAREGLKVALTGLGADELFGGYPSFRDVPRWNAALGPVRCVPFLAEASSIAARAAGVPPKWAGLLRYGGRFEGAYFARRGLFMPWELPGLMGRDAARDGLRRLGFLRDLRALTADGPRGPYARVAALEASFYMRHQLLRDADWAGMAHSLEIRTPYVDVWLLRALAPSLAARAGASGKGPLTAALSKPLPAEILERPKTGFGLPLGRWMEELDELSAWRKVPALRAPVHWSRRWAAVVRDAWRRP